MTFDNAASIVVAMLLIARDPVDRGDSVRLTDVR